MTTTTKETDEPLDQSEGPVNEGCVRPSIAVKMIRHAESRNNQVYRDARFIYRGGTPDFDEEGWLAYVNEHRKADPGLSSDLGYAQADKLATDFLIPHLYNQASHPVRFVVSPMRRTLETIRPTIQGLISLQQETEPAVKRPICDITIHGFYHESEGCHTNNIAEEGMTPQQTKEHLLGKTDGEHNNPTGKYEKSTESYKFSSVGFPEPGRGWYCHATKNESRAESEVRAAKFYTWLCEYLDQQLEEAVSADDLFDAGVSVQGEEHEDEHDKHSARLRRRRTAILVGHADFMSLVLQRVVAGFGHTVETTGIPHRSAFVHWNTGITELEYFGQGRFLIMGQNHTPHFTPLEYSKYRSGGSLKDGWSYVMPSDQIVLNAEVSVAFADEELPPHVKEQTRALKSLYLSSKSETTTENNNDEPENESKSKLTVEEEENSKDKKDHVKHFVVKRGLQVVAVATYSEVTGLLSDVAVRPSAGKQASQILFKAVKDHSQKLGRSGSLHVMPRTEESKDLLQALGFQESSEDIGLQMESAD